MIPFFRFLSRHPSLFCLWRIVLIGIGRVVFFWRRPRVTGDNIFLCITQAHKGDVIAVGSRRYLTSLLIPGKYDHTMIYDGDGHVIHAVSPRIKRESIVDVLRHYDGFKLLRPQLPYIPLKTIYSASLAEQKKCKYDFVFLPNNNAYYCHEFTATMLSKGGKEVEKAGDCFYESDIASVCDVVMEV